MELVDCIYNILQYAYTSAYNWGAPAWMYECQKSLRDKAVRFGSQANQRSRTERSIWKTSFLRNNEAVNSPSWSVLEWLKWTWDPSGTCTHGCDLGALIDPWGIESIYFHFAHLCTSASWVPDQLMCFQIICRESNLFTKKLQVLQNLCNLTDRHMGVSINGGTPSHHPF